MQLRMLCIVDVMGGLSSPGQHSQRAHSYQVPFQGCRMDEPSGEEGSRESHRSSTARPIEVQIRRACSKTSPERRSRRCTLHNSVGSVDDWRGMLKLEGLSR
jgi:hypothetical protein